MEGRRQWQSFGSAILLSVLLLVTVTTIAARELHLRKDQGQVLPASRDALSACKLNVATPAAPKHAGILAEPHKKTLFLLSIDCSGASSMEKFEFRSRGPSAEYSYGSSPTHLYTVPGPAKLWVEACPVRTAPTAGNWCSRESGQQALEVKVAVTYVRRELRSLSVEDRERYFASIKATYRYNGDEGRAKFGNKYRSYNEMLAKHTASVWVRRGLCNLGHDGPAFMPFHRAFIKEFEESMQAVDPSVASHYWDYLADGSLPDARKSEIFSNNFFGSANGNAQENYAVTDGQFAYTTVPFGEEAKRLAKMTWGEYGPSNMTSPYGYFRSRDNMNRNKYLTRYGPTSRSKLPDRAAWLKCSKYSSLGHYLRCTDYTQIHPGPHIYIGGITGLPTFEDVKSVINCDPAFEGTECSQAFELMSTVAANLRVPEVLNGCLVCDKKCTSFDQHPSECACECNAERTMCSATNVFKRNLFKLGLVLPDKFVNLGSNLSGYGTCAPEAAPGDYADIAASTQDPIFYPHHTNLDRLSTSWRRLHAERPLDAVEFTWPNKDNDVYVDVWSASSRMVESGKYFPGVFPPGDHNPTGRCPGHGLYDENAMGAFQNLFRSLPKNKPHTNFELLQTVDLEINDVANAEYIYDLYDSAEEELVQAQ